MSVFGHEYADCYDVFYGDKDYSAECDLVEAVFRKCGDPARGRQCSRSSSCPGARPCPRYPASSR